MTLDLETLQRRFFDLLRAPRGVAQALTDGASDPGGRPLLGWIRADTEDQAIERLDVYANMYFFRLEDTLKDDFPKVLLLIGEADFRNLATDYVWACPASEPALRHFGARLPAFLSTHPLAERHFGLADLALLEWSWVGVFDAEDVPLLSVEHVASLPADAWPTIALRLAPHVVRLSLSTRATELWTALAAGQRPPIVQPKPETVLLWRQGFRVFFRAIEGPEAQALSRVDGGTTFGAVCEHLVGPDGDVPKAAHAAAGLLRRWIGDGLLQVASRDCF